MAEKTTITVKTEDGSESEYMWFDDGDIYEAGGWSGVDEKIGSADSLEDAIAIIKSYEGDVIEVDVD